MINPSAAVIVAMGIRVQGASVLAFKVGVLIVGAIDPQRRTIESQNALGRDNEGVCPVDTVPRDSRDTVADVLVIPRLLAVELKAVVEEVRCLAQEKLLDWVKEGISAPFGAEHEESVVLLASVLGRVQVEVFMGDLEPPTDVEERAIDSDVAHVVDDESSES